MADKHPYLSGIGAIYQTVNHLRKSFPNEINSETLKKLGIAKNNESKIISILKFLKVLDETGNKTEEAGKIFVIHNDNEFQKEFSVLIKNAYSDLFELYKEDAWTLDIDKLIGYFRQSDQTSSTVGRYQCGTFQALASLAGKIEISIPKQSQDTSTKAKKVKPTTAKEKIKKTPAPAAKNNNTQSIINSGSDFGLTVRVEINLPANANKETYDAIFKSIRENLIEAK